MYILAIFMIAYFSIMYSNGYDQKNNSDIVLNSFPIHRKDVVRGKYVLLIIYTIIFSVSIVILTNVFLMIGIGKGWKPAGIWDVMAAMNLLLLFYSIYYPVYFKSENGLATFNQLMVMLIILAPSLLNRFGEALVGTPIVNVLVKMNAKDINIILFIFAIIIYYISLQISRKIYSKKEF